MNRVAFLLDGFNLYHSARTAARDLGGASTKWLDFRSLAESYLYILGGGARLGKILYFSALAFHVDARRPGTTKRHKQYMQCLRAKGIEIHLGRFKYKAGWCPSCRAKTDNYEEKETDVAISVALLELLLKDECDTAVLVTGDTDVAPAIRSARRLFPTKTIAVAFPYRRKNNELARLVDTSFRIRKERYAQHQLEDPFKLPTGREIRKPPSW